MTRNKLISILLAVVIIVSAVIISGCSAGEVYRLIKVNSFDGDVSVQRGGKMSAFNGMQLVPEDSVEVGGNSFLELLADSDKHIAAEENTGFVIHCTGTAESGSMTIDLLYGKALFTIDNKLRETSTFYVKTPNATLSIRGTSFSVEYNRDEMTTKVEVTSGKVLVSYDDKELNLISGSAVTLKTVDGIVKVIDLNQPGNETTSSSDLTKPVSGETYQCYFIVDRYQVVYSDSAAGIYKKADYRILDGDIFEKLGNTPSMGYLTNTGTVALLRTCIYPDENNYTIEDTNSLSHHSDCDYSLLDGIINHMESESEALESHFTKMRDENISKTDFVENKWLPEEFTVKSEKGTFLLTVEKVKEIDL